jgi:kynurenine formamidase
MQLFPVFPKPVFVQWTRRETYGFETEAMFLVTHTGTHLDAPYHFYSKGKKVNEIPAEKLVGDALVLDFATKRVKSLITAREIRRAESKAGEEIRSGDILLVRTGWDRFLGDEKYTSSYPGLSKDAAEYLLKRRIKALGVDNPNPDHPKATDFPVHNTLLPKGILIIENLANLGSISRTRFRFVGLPLKIRNGTGSPIRAIAIED